MPTLFDHNLLPGAGKLVTDKDLKIQNTELVISFDQALTNASDPNIYNSHDKNYDGKNLIWTTDLNMELPIRLTPDGYGSEQPLTLVEAFANAVKSWSHLPALFYRPKNQLDKPWHMYTWQAYWNDCCKFAKSLITIGVENKSVTCIMGFNTPSWLIANFGTIFIGSISSGIYPSSNADLVKYIINHCGASVIVVDTVVNLEKLLSIQDQIPSLKKIVMYYDNVSPFYKSKGIISFNEFLDIGRNVSDNLLSSKMSNQKPGQCCSMIYTSGTTGNPKAVMLSNDNCTWTGWITSKYTGSTPSDNVVSYLPLCHIAAQIIDVYSPLFCGHQVYFANIDALQGSLLATLKEVRPSWFLGVPRVYEKMEIALKAAGSQSPNFMKKVSAWARQVGFEGTTNLLQGKPTTLKYKVTDQLVFRKILKALGLDQCKGLAVTAAPVLKTTQEYFLSLGIPLCNIYGLSEITGPHSFSICAPHWFKLGSAGCTMCGAESHISNPDETGVGEVCVRGRHVFMGYYKDEKSTRAAIDKYGFFHTGDTGRFDNDGHMFIVGRIKELIITAGGENIAPLTIEGIVQKHMPFIANCQLVGDGRQFLSLLICLRAQVSPEGLPTTQLDPTLIKEFRNFGSHSTSTIEASRDPIIIQRIEDCISKVNSEVPSRAHHIRKWTILSHDFSEAGGELTSTLKLKRAFVIKKYDKLIESLYNSNQSTPASKL